MEPQDEEVQRTCFDCNCFFPASMGEFTEFGVCLSDEEFEPYIDELLENCNYACCKELVERKKFDGNREACADFSESETGENFEIPHNSELESAILSAIKNGQFNADTFEQLILEEQVRNVDFATLPIDRYSQQLKSSEPEQQRAAISSLGALAGQGNKAAFDELFRFLQELGPPKTIEDVHFRVRMLERLEVSQFMSALPQYLVEQLHKTPSNNTTRQWIWAVLRVLARCREEEVREPLTKMLRDKRFSYKLKRRIRETLYELDLRSRRFS